ncbi:four-carbon acid sugar kinase family protein [Occultella kanbiaonis]|uniref:four-carbon acid sugar kinase family protein n=1 Tax=Occultella kanbiaonis TaxID=2675754 RepID=UPI0012B7A5CF|nr:four-carbon acid sugar kinase family protein [Occultella kanbiaonis]
MRLGFYGDDFTGSVDALLQLRAAGLTGVLATSVAAAERLGDDHDVVGIAGVARSLPTEELAAEVVPALRWFAGRGAPIVQYKACSTADSSPVVGSLGRVLELGREVFGQRPVPVLFAQPDFGRYTFFGHHFASDGERVFRLDRQPTMRAHPVTPSTESDLVRHLGAQTDLPIAALDWRNYGPTAEPASGASVAPRVGSHRAGAASAQALTADNASAEAPRVGRADAVALAITATGAAAVVLDAFTADHLDLAGAAILLLPGDRPRFVLGAGGLSLGVGRVLARARPDTNRTAQDRLGSAVVPAEGAVLALSGSRSARTWEQILAATRAGWTAVDLREPGAVERAVAAHAGGANTVFHSTTPGGEPVPSDRVVADLAEVGRARLRAAPRTRLLVCGGDTSGHLLRGLDVDALTISARPWGNVVLCRAHASGHPYDGAAMVLKGGQMGHQDLFEDVRLGRASTTSDPMEEPARC